ncbi:hypothetical protein GIB67_039387, partial [Kingdonia uniflora]
LIHNRLSLCQQFEGIILYTWGFDLNSTILRYQLKEEEKHHMHLEEQTLCIRKIKRYKSLSPLIF